MHPFDIRINKNLKNVDFDKTKKKIYLHRNKKQIISTTIEKIMTILELFRI